MPRAGTTRAARRLGGFFFVPCGKQARQRIKKPFLGRGTDPDLWHLTAQYGDRSFGEYEGSLGIRGYGRSDRRMIRIGVTVGAVVDPHILLAPEGHDVDRA